jgi:integrase
MAATGRNWENKTEKRRFPFTEQRIEKLPRPKPKTRVCYYDNSTKGLGVKCEASGAQTYFWFRSVVDKFGRGGPKWVSLGETGSTSLETAQAKAGKLNNQRDDWKNGRVEKNPFVEEKPVEPVKEMTLGQLLEQYLRIKGPEFKNPLRAVREENYRAAHFAYLNDRPISGITRGDVLELRENILRDSGKVTANRAVSQLQRMYKWAADELKWTGESPAARIKRGQRFKEQSRTRYIYPHERIALDRALDTARNQNAADFVRLALATGARRSNVAALNFKDVDLQRCTWTIPDTKNGEGQTVELVPQAVAVLKRRLAQRREPDNNWCFPGRGKSGHLEDPKKAWKEIKAEAAKTAPSIANVTIHDCRRTVGSWMAIAGCSLPQIGAVLGHKSIRSTEVYARLSQDAQRSALTKGLAELSAAMRAAADTNDRSAAAAKALAKRPKLLKSA